MPGGLFPILKDKQQEAGRHSHNPAQHLQVDEHVGHFDCAPFNRLHAMPMGIWSTVTCIMFLMFMLALTSVLMSTSR